MEYTQLSNLSQKVSKIGLGSWAIGGWMWGGTDEKLAVETIHRALDLGITLIDTAPIYGFGKSEEIVGKAVKSYGKRDQIVIATKAGLRWDENQKPYRDARKKQILEEVDASLKRLQVNTIDLYQIHWPDTEVSMAETAEAMNLLLHQGKIRSIGVSNFSLDQMKEFEKTAPIHSLQSPFNLFEQEIIQNEVPYCLKREIAILGYGPLCRGLLSGKMNKNTSFKKDDIRSFDPKFKEPAFSQYLACVSDLKKWANEHQRSLISVVLRYALDKGITVPLWGARKPEQLSELESVWGWQLSPQDLKDIEGILKKNVPQPISPSFMAPGMRKKAVA